MRETKVIKTKFALVLRQLRENSGLTQKQVAKELNVERSTYSYYETAVTSPSCSSIIRMSKIFNVHYSVFMDAIADTAFDESKDGNSFTTLTNKPSTKRDKIYELTKSEQNLILAYRMMTAEQKNELIKKLGVNKRDNFDKN